MIAGERREAGMKVTIMVLGVVIALVGAMGVIVAAGGSQVFWLFVMVTICGVCVAGLAAALD